MTQAVFGCHYYLTGYSAQVKRTACSAWVQASTFCIVVAYRATALLAHHVIKRQL
jgi:hypothetical protein